MPLLDEKNTEAHNNYTLLERIFSIKNSEDKKHKVITTLGLKLKIKRKKYLFEQLVYKNSMLNAEISVLQSYVLDKIIQNRINHLDNNTTYFDFIDSILNKENVLLASWLKEPEKYMKNYPKLFNKNACFISSNIRTTEYRSIFWGTHFKLRDNINMLEDIILKQNKYAIAEMGFLFRISTNFRNDKDGVSFIFDDIAPYFDARYTNRLEQMLNDKNLIITDEQKLRARKCIDKIIETHLTKYNHQPIFKPDIGRKNVKKVLVVDQSYGDMSIAKGWANDKTFKIMLDSAIKENPDADIIIKTHPDNISKKSKSGYYSEIVARDNVYKVTYPINPISMIKYVDKVYVCSSQFGFEALMAGKEVHTFGMPFYAGWGLTNDAQKCERRTNKRTLEEMFYITYILYSYYVNPKTNKRCEIEEAMNYLLEMREQYFKNKGDF